MSNNVKNDNHKETMADIYNSLSDVQKVFFDADIQTCWMLGEEIGQANQNSAYQMKKCELNEDQQNLLIEMRQNAFSTARKVGQYKAQGITPEEISKKMGIPLKKIKKEEPDDGSSKNDQ